MNYNVADQEKESKKACGELTRRASQILGRPGFASNFNHSNYDAQSQLVGDWISRLTGPFLWMRKCLINIWSEGDKALVIDILRFFCSPFDFIPVAKPWNTNNTEREILQFAKIELKNAHKILKEIDDAINESGEAGCQISENEYLRIKRVCGNGVESLLALEEFAKENFVK